MKKIALCFLTYQNLSQPKLWYKIINNNLHKINVYIHNKSDFKDDEYGLHNYCIKKHTETKYAHISIVQATLNLFEEAFKNNENEYFVLLSDKTIPLYNFDYIYKKINKLNTNIISNEKYKSIERFEDLTDKNFFNINNFFKQSQWIVLNRNSTKFFINNNFTYLYSDNFYAPDEHYFINLCIKFNINFLEKQITYTNWEDKKGSPKTYFSLTNEFIHDIKKNNDILFIRKISNDCILPSYFDKIC